MLVSFLFRADISNRRRECAGCCAGTRVGVVLFYYVYLF